jgi:hypothetical protein
MIRLALVAVCIALTGCSFTTRHGDAKVRHIDNRLLGKGKGKRLTLPEFSISEPGVHRFDVVRLPLPIYPREVVVGTPWEDHVDERMEPRPPDAPWRRVLLEVVFLDEDGGVVYEKWLDLSKERASWRGIYRQAPVRTAPKRTAEAVFDLYDYGEQISDPPLLAYQVVVSVDDPSPRPGLKAYLTGSAPDPPRLTTSQQRLIDQSTIMSQLQPESPRP